MTAYILHYVEITNVPDTPETRRSHTIIAGSESDAFATYHALTEPMTSAYNWFQIRDDDVRQRYFYNFLMYRGDAVI